MAYIKVCDGNYGSYLRINYSFAFDQNTRIWTCYAALEIVLPPWYEFGPWGNTGTHTAILQADGLPDCDNKSNPYEVAFTLVPSRQVATGTLGEDETTITANVTWAFNVNSPWGGFVDPQGTAILTGVIETGGKVNAKVNGAWKKGQVFVKVNGAWVKAKKVFVKVNGTWQQAK